jgi:type IV fimbrial biogenesis protein FimT
MSKTTGNRGWLSGSDGFTMVELLIVLTIAAVLVTVGTPSYLSTITAYRISTEVNELLGDLQYARSEAVKQGTAVQMCISTDGATCSTSATSWGAGHIVVASPFGKDCTAAGNCTLLRTQQRFSGADTAVSVNGETSIAFSRDGFAGTPSTTHWNGFSPLAQPIVLTVHDAHSSVAADRCVVINPVGQMSVLAPSTSTTTQTAAAAQNAAPTCS